MKKILPMIGLGFLFVAGLMLLFYPDISNWLIERSHIGEIQEYELDVAEMTAQAIEQEREKAEEYNDALSGTNITDPFIPGTGMVLPKNYTSVLNMDGKIGYLEIPKIGVSLPIYHGTGEDVLKKGVGHMENTAFPIGGQGNHTVLTGHTGLSSAKIFTDLNRLELGDVFYITVLDETLCYQVDQILTVEPHETNELRPVKGEDYVTLMTCTPYAINSHRLLVRGIRIPYSETRVVEQDQLSGVVNWRIVIIVIFFILLAMTLGVYLFMDRRRKKDRR